MNDHAYRASDVQKKVAEPSGVHILELVSLTVPIKSTECVRQAALHELLPDFP
jgi:hypothetical protein